MNVKLLRSIDKWVGVPMCFGASLILHIHRWFQKDKPACSHSPKNILFLELSEMGSTVLAFPSIRYIQKQYPEAQLYFLTFRQNRFSVELLRIFPEKHILTIDPSSPWHFLYSTYRAFKAIREKEMDTVFDMELFSRFSALLTGLSGAQRRVGYRKQCEEGLYRGSLMTHGVAYNCHQHMWKNFMALVMAIERTGEVPLVKGAVSDDFLVIPRFESTVQDKKDLLERLSRLNSSIGEAGHLVLMNPSAGSLLPIRGWPSEHYQSLAKKIVTTYGAIIILIGLDEAHAQATRICEAVGRRHCIDFTGQTSFRDLMDLMNLADVLITADSGPAHFASFTDIHNIVLFGPETPNLYGPLGEKVTVMTSGFLCSPCLSAYNHRDTPCRDARCMEAITVEQVFQAVSKAIDAKVKQ